MQLNKSLLQKKDLQVATGVVLESVYLKLYKIAWANAGAHPLTTPSRIFFSVWVNDQTIRENKMMYNIHALKLRELKGYKITSREFAAAFRKLFKHYESEWPNVSTDFGPLTLMEGWMPLNEKSIQADIIKISNQFLIIAPLIDQLLQTRK